VHLFDAPADPESALKPRDKQLLASAPYPKVKPEGMYARQIVTYEGKEKPGTIVVIIHNGLGPDEAAASILGKGHVAVGVSYSGVTFLEPGKVRLAGYTETVLGSIEPEVAARLSAARDALEKAGLRARIAGDIRAAQWEKLYANIAINPVTGHHGPEQRRAARGAGAQDTCRKPRKRGRAGLEGHGHKNKRRPAGEHLQGHQGHCGQPLVHAPGRHAPEAHGDRRA